MTLTTVPEGVCSFVEWTGDVPPGKQYDNPLVLQPGDYIAPCMFLTAHFTSLWGGMDQDCNGNGVPDGCEGYDCNENDLLDDCETFADGDFDNDGDVDPDDFAALAGALAGPGVPLDVTPPECIDVYLAVFDADGDDDLDLADFAMFQVQFTGSGE